MKTAPAILAAAALMVMAMPVAAQDHSMTLQSQGNVMVSSGGEFETAASGAQLEAGNRIMLAEGARARVIFDNGCDVTYEEAGVYNIPSNCTPVATANTGSDWGSAGLIAGGVAVGAALLNNMDEVEYTPAPPAPPVSR